MLPDTGGYYYDADDDSATSAVRRTYRTFRETVMSGDLGKTVATATVGGVAVYAVRTSVGLSLGDDMDTDAVMNR